MIAHTGHGLTDIDSLALAVRDRESRRLIVEAISAYRGGAFRSAVMSTWVAVAYDIISKARELSAQGEGAARAFIADLDHAIEHKNVRRLQAFESEILKIANVDLILLAPHEYEALARMQADRNLCAHPAFVVEDALYQPTSELVRTHLVHALEYLLIHAPLQGKSAIARFEADILSASFPTASEDIGTYVRAKYLDRAKEVLVINLVKGLVTAPFGAESAIYAGKEWLLARVMREIAAAKPGIFDATTPSVVERRFDSVDDDQLLKVGTYLAADARFWLWLSEPTRLRVKTLLTSAPLILLKQCSAFDAFAIPELADVLMGRFDAFDQATQINVIAENPRREFVQRAIAIYGNAGGWRQAETIGQALIVRLAPMFTAENVQEMLLAVTGNAQVSEAAGTASVLGDVFEATRPLLSTARDHWQVFVDAMTVQQRGNATASYAYPNIRALLAFA